MITSRTKDMEHCLIYFVVDSGTDTVWIFDRPAPTIFLPQLDKDGLEQWRYESEEFKGAVDLCDIAHNIWDM